jgi:hypothetical protein
LQTESEGLWTATKYVLKKGLCWANNTLYICDRLLYTK